MVPVKRFSLAPLRQTNVPYHTPESAGRPHGGGGGAYQAASLVSAVMLARIGPVKPFLLKALIAHSDACGRAERTAQAQPRARAARHAPHRRENGRA
jgi:hypothetical protein